MFAMFNQLFATITLFFSAMEKLASAGNHLGTALDEAAGAYEDEQRIKRQAAMNAMLKENKVTEKQLNAVK